MRTLTRYALISTSTLFWAAHILAQGGANAAPAGSDSLTITLDEALTRAQKYSTQIQTANIAVELARQDRRQAKAATLPSVSAFNQFIYTEGNGTPSGVFVANDGVHVYNEQLQAHEELLAFIRRGEVRVAEVAAAVAQARADVTARGLKATVIQNYYAVAAAQRKLANAQQSSTEAQQFLDITQKQERGGEAAHSDVIKAQLPVLQRQRDVQDAQLSAAKAKIALAVLIFPSLQVSYAVVDDLAQLPILPPLAEATAQANVTSPDLRAARLSLNQARLSVNVARYAYLPSLGLDVFYGIDANQFAARTNYATQATGRSTLPNYLVPYRQNLGYVAQVTLTVPLWNWGTTRSRVQQAALRRQQAELDLTLSQKQLEANLASYYQEAQTALSQIESLRSSSELSAESLRLTTLRYQAGEATALEVVDAQATANAARSAYNDGLVRYRVALATLQTLTGFQP
ncbi:MAG: TolC family protein [Acidobacteriaceae bacterium]|nr:TolC family protein [Acidobacteriaceae bacterium]